MQLAGNEKSIAGGRKSAEKPVASCNSGAIYWCEQLLLYSSISGTTSYKNDRI